LRIRRDNKTAVKKKSLNNQGEFMFFPRWPKQY